MTKTMTKATRAAMSRAILPVALVLSIGACARAPQTSPGSASMTNPITPLHVTRHADGDDLLTAGLGLAGLRSSAPPAFADPSAPTPEELRRRAIWTNWRGIADLIPGGGYGDVYGTFAEVPGTERQAFAYVPGAKQPHRVLLQLPDAFDRKARCVVVAASSGSRGIYGAISLAGAWGLPRGCAVAYTDKGAGTGYFDLDTDTGVRLDGTRGVRGEPLEFTPPPGTPGAHRVAVKHANSGDNPEADWGRHVLQAAEFALQTLSEALPNEKRFTFDNTRVIAVGLSNGGGAVLRAAELDRDGHLAGVVAIAPNVFPGARDARPMYDVASEAALLQPCALIHTTFDNEAFARPGGKPAPTWIARCAALHERGMLAAPDLAGQAAEAYARLREHGWTDGAMRTAATSASFDLWRAVGVAYASAYGRHGADAMPCGYAYAALDASGAPRATTPEEQAAWFADVSGIPPSPTVGIVDTLAGGADPTLPGLLCLRDLWTNPSADAERVRAGVAATRAGLPRNGLPLVVVHGADDVLIPEPFTGGAYARWVNGSGGDVRYWRVANAQHFDAFLAFPTYAARYVPLLPYAYAALDAMWAHVADGAPLPPSADIAPTPRAPGTPLPQPLTRENLGAIPK
jgi:hydroxybutyrate-dimer hydrolase